MFMRYFVDRFRLRPIRPTSIIQDLLHSDQFGLDSLVSVSGEGSFVPLFRDWLTAVYISCHPELKADFTDNNHYIKDLSLVSEPLKVEPFSNQISIPDTTGQFQQRRSVLPLVVVPISNSECSCSRRRGNLVLAPSNSSCKR